MTESVTARLSLALLLIALSACGGPSGDDSAVRAPGQQSSGESEVVHPSEMNAAPPLYPYQGPTVFEAGVGGRAVSEVPSFVDPDAVMPSRGRIELLTLKVGYLTDEGIEMEFTTGEIEDRLFSENPSDEVYSMREYYRDNSFYDPEDFDPTPRHLDDETVGSLDLPGTVMPPGEEEIYKLDREYTGGEDSDPYHEITEEDMRGWLEAADEDIDFSKFDADGNGVIDGILFIFPREIPNFVPFTRQQVELETEFDGVEFRRASFFQQSFLGNGTRYFEHETGHLMGLPDYYDYGPLADRFSGGEGNPGEDGDEWWGPGYWDIMAWGTFASDGSMHSALNRTLLHWEQADTVEYNVDDRVLLNADTPEGRGRVLRVDVPETSKQEYFMLEARENDFQPVTDGGFLTPPAEEPGPGLLVWHVDRGVVDLFLDDEQRPDNMFGVNDFEDPGPELHPFIRLLQADSDGDLLSFGEDGSGGNIGDAGDPAPGLSGNRVLDGTSEPRLRSYDDSFEFSISAIQTVGNNQGVEMDIDVGRPIPTVDITSPSDLSFYDVEDENNFQIPVTVEIPEDSDRVGITLAPVNDPDNVLLSVVRTGGGTVNISTGALDNGRYLITASGRSDAFGFSEDSIRVDLMAKTGDLNGDGEVNTEDAEELESLLPLNIDTGSSEYRAWLDPNRDGSVDERDLPVIAWRMLADGDS